MYRKFALFQTQNTTEYADKFWCRVTPTKNFFLVQPRRVTSRCSGGSKKPWLWKSIMDIFMIWGLVTEKNTRL